MITDDRQGYALTGFRADDRRLRFNVDDFAG